MRQAEIDEADHRVAGVRGPAPRAPRARRPSAPVRHIAGEPAGAGGEQQVLDAGRHGVAVLAGLAPGPRPGGRSTRSPPAPAPGGWPPSPGRRPRGPARRAAGRAGGPRRSRAGPSPGDHDEPPRRREVVVGRADGRPQELLDHAPAGSGRRRSARRCGGRGWPRRSRRPSGVAELIELLLVESQVVAQLVQDGDRAPAPPGRRGRCGGRSAGGCRSRCARAGIARRRSTPSVRGTPV